MKFENIAAVVVHHRSYATLAATIDRLLAEGLSPSKVLVVDNSEEPSKEALLRSNLPEGVELIFCANSGYGAAVNLGVRWHAENTKDAGFLLVSTHEALPEAGALRHLESELNRNASAGIVGPALVTGADSELVWSLGGHFSKYLGLPRHYAHKTPRNRLDTCERREVSWLDGAFLLFRKDVIERHPIDEAFFLYMEETDQQQSIRRQGWSVILEPAAVVWQSSGGTPAFYQTRNIQLFQAKNGSWLQKTASAPYVVARAVVRDLAKGRGVSEWPKLFAGWREGLSLTPKPAAGSDQRIVIVNPLGGALAHYTMALAENLRASGAAVEVHPISEPSLSGTGRLRWLLEYLRLLRKASRKRHGLSQTLVTWPVGGFLDLLLVKVLCGRTAAIVYHDPKPLVRAIGSGRLVARLVAAIPNLPEVIVHSEAAADAMRKIGLGSSLEILPHPMLRPSGKEALTARDAQRPVVRVLGQFKQDRDVESLQTIASRLGSEYTLEIVGRGWPTVDGWSVDSRFVSEQEMDDLVRTSDAIVVPYKRFYQSGIAIRALEAGTPIVGRAASSLADLYGADSKLLVVEDSGAQTSVDEPWSRAIRHAVTHGVAEAHDAGSGFFDKAVFEWRSWISRND